MTPADFLVVDGITVHFGGIHALSDVSFSIKRGELVALIGPNGAGKSTLLGVIAGAILPTVGHVFYQGDEVTGQPPHLVNAKGIARTFQAAELVRSLSVRENAMSGGAAATKLGWLPALTGLSSSNQARRHLEHKADELLELVGLSEQATQLAGTLPAGQQRLLAIARALATGAELLILDEPGAGLNEVEKRHLVNVVRAIWEMGKTVVFIEHDMEFVDELAQRILVLDRGRLIADGQPDTVRSDPAVIAAYLGVGHRPPTITPRPVVCAKPLLVIDELSVRYGGITALDRVSLEVRTGELVALVGANGAGKSTLLKAISKVVATHGGSLQFNNRNLGTLDPDRVVNAGISLVPEGRELFPSLTVLDNLLVGRFPCLRRSGWWHALTHGRPSDAAIARQLDMIYTMFPVLRERSNQLAGTLSGGQAQMLAIGRALMAEPRLLMLDEPSLGIAPQVVADIMNALLLLRSQGVTVLLVEQNARAALEIADRGYMLAAGKIVASGSAPELLADPGILQAYLGGVESARMTCQVTRLAS